jgi:hypothetical protein
MNLGCVCFITTYFPVFDCVLENVLESISGNLSLALFFWSPQKIKSSSTHINT